MPYLIRRQMDPAFIIIHTKVLFITVNRLHATIDPKYPGC
jgi:hypothetical protein